jgi:hypothetical protein
MPVSGSTPEASTVTRGSIRSVDETAGAGAAGAGRELRDAGGCAVCPAAWLAVSPQNKTQSKALNGRMTVTARFVNILGYSINTPGPESYRSKEIFSSLRKTTGKEGRYTPLPQSLHRSTTYW